MARLIVDFYKEKTEFFCMALMNRGKRTHLGALLHRRKKRGGIKIRDRSKAQPKVNMAIVAKALGADMAIPLNWVHSFRTDEDTLTIIFEDGVGFQADGDKLFFIKDDETGLAPADIVRRVYKFGDAVKSLEVLWENK